MLVVDAIWTATPVRALQRGTRLLRVSANRANSCSPLSAAGRRTILPWRVGPIGQGAEVFVTDTLLETWTTRVQATLGIVAGFLFLQRATAKFFGVPHVAARSHRRCAGVGRSC